MTIWFLLDAFHIPQSLENAGLVQVSSSVATLFPITPAGIGTEQAFLLYVLSGVASASVLLAFSVGAKLTLTIDERRRRLHGDRVDASQALVPLPQRRLLTE